MGDTTVLTQPTLRKVPCCAEQSAPARAVPKARARTPAEAGQGKRPRRPGWWREQASLGHQPSPWATLALRAPGRALGTRRAAWPARTGGLSSALRSPCARASDPQLEPCAQAWLCPRQPVRAVSQKNKGKHDRLSVPVTKWSTNGSGGRPGNTG